MTSITIFSDGGARGNPGPAASSFIVYKDKKLVYKNSKYLGKTTNNVAEYEGVVMALDYLIVNDLGTNVLFKMDSELAIKQLTGIYKVKDKRLMNYVLQIKTLVKENNLDINWMYVPRSQNKLADKMVNEKLDESSRH